MSTTTEDYECTNAPKKLLATSARQLQDAAAEAMSNDLCISRARVAGYKTLQAVQIPLHSALEIVGRLIQMVYIHVPNSKLPLCQMEICAARPG